jgi:hypothetical protein
MANTKLSPIDRAVFDLAEHGLLDDHRAKAYAGAVANLQNLGLIVRQRNGVYVLRSQLLNPDGSSQLTPPKRPAPEPMFTLGIRVPVKWVETIDPECARRRIDRSAFARDILGPANEGTTYREGKYNPKRLSQTEPPPSSESGEHVLGGASVGRGRRRTG